MKTKMKKGLKWIMGTILLLIVIKLVMEILGGGAHPVRPHMYFGYGDYGHAPFMRGHHPMGGFHFIQSFIWSIVTVSLGLAAIVILFGWFKRKDNTRGSNHSITEIPFSYTTHNLTSYQADFLDEWEKNQNRHKEEQ
jgi:ABC-type branched-subunit amino acid transport system permease subunit